MEVPEARVAADVVTSDLASERPAGEMFIRFEQSVVRDPELALR
jgi:hypothetical protein